MGTHKRLSPSSLPRIFKCPGSLLFIEKLPESDLDRSDSLPARRGTAGHGVSEIVLNSAKINKEGKVKTSSHAADFEGQEIEGVIIDTDILAAIVPYIEYCKKLIAKSKFHGVELNLDLSNWQRLDDSTVDGQDLGGTMDFVCTYKGKVRKTKILEVVDLKTGSGVVVEVNDNIQLLVYALLALLNYGDGRGVSDIKITIVQSAAPHQDGPVRSQTISKKDLMKWAKKELIPKLEFALSGNAPLIAGESQCKWCPARGNCQAAYELTCQEAHAEFADIIEKDDKGKNIVLSEVVLPNPETMTAEQRARIMLHTDVIIDFLHAVKSLEHIKAERGEVPEGFKLVRKRSNRIYVGKEGKRLKQLKLMGLTSADIYTPPNVRTPAQMEEVMKARGVSLKSIKKFMEDYVEKPEGGTNLVPLSKAGAPVPPAIDVEFAHLIEPDEDDLLSF